VKRLPLDGIRVLDIATLVAAPMVATYLGDFGADVIKVEQPRLGDHQRRWGSRKRGTAIYWKSISRNKRSITLDLRKPEGAALLKRLVEKADVLIENFRPGTLEKWGLSFASLSAINPRLVMLRISGFGQSGPYRARPGFGSVVEAMTGFAHVTGQPDGPPTLPSLPLADGMAAITGAFAVMVALYHRDVNGGIGQEIDLSLCDPMLRLMEPLLLDWDQLQISQTRTGSRSPHVVPRNAYECAGGEWVVLSASSQSIFERLAAAIGMPQLVADSRFSTNDARVRNVDELDRIIAAWVGSRSRQEVLRVMDQTEVAAGPVYDLPAVYSDEHFRTNGSFADVVDTDLGPMKMVGVGPRFSETPGRISSTGPSLGQDNDSVYGELDLSPEKIRALGEEGVL
jgi:crotonobetainyl-CoA:carnitine CoA-transferase CaiB-like acyl-CoA transferase